MGAVLLEGEYGKKTAVRALDSVILLPQATLVSSASPYLVMLPDYGNVSSARSFVTPK